MPGPLEGIRVVDCTAIVSGPFCTMLLADQGAEVIKVEVPGAGDLVRYAGTLRGGMAAGFAVLNRGKRSLVLDLRQEQGREVLRRWSPARTCSRRTSGRAPRSAREWRTKTCAP